MRQSKRANESLLILPSDADCPSPSHGRGLFLEGGRVASDVVARGRLAGGLLDPASPTPTKMEVLCGNISFERVGIPSRKSRPSASRCDCEAARRAHPPR